jgi:hypothetical protein
MRRSLVVFLLVSSLAAFGQGRPGSHPGGPPSSAPGPASGSGMGNDRGMSGDNGSMAQSHGMSQAQQPLRDAQVSSGAFRMLEKKMGMTSAQLQALYSQSGAKNFGQFVSAIVVSKNLNLDTQKVLDGLKTASLGQTLQNLGVDKKKAKEEIKKAEKKAKDADHES